MTSTKYLNSHNTQSTVVGFLLLVLPSGIPKCISWASNVQLNLPLTIKAMKSALHQTVGEEDSSSTPLQDTALQVYAFKTRSLHMEHTHLSAAMGTVVSGKCFLKQ